MSGKILAVDDGPEVLNLLDVVLNRRGYKVNTAKSVKEAVASIKKEKPDLILLDILLPDTSGIHLTENLKRTEDYSDIPIILLTSKDTDIDMITGLKTGADDYVVKPFNSDVLLARVEALLRRCKPSVFSPNQHKVGEITIQGDTKEVSVNGGTVELTPSEFKIIYELAKKEGNPIGRERLSSSIGYDGNSRIVDTHITAIRRKLGKARKYLRTVHGFGYKLVSI